MKLCNLIDFVNQHKTLPLRTDDSELFYLYKPEQYRHQDITDHFFIKRSGNSIDYSGTYTDPYSLLEDQFRPYSSVSYTILKPFIDHYFTCSQTIQDLQATLIKNYVIDVSNTCAIYYRGTDKQQETPLGSFESYAQKMSEMIQLQSDIQFIIQTDTYPFIEYMLAYANRLQIQNNIIIIEENLMTDSTYGLHYIRQGNNAYNDIKYLLATMNIMAQCKHIICSSGNVSLWILLLRGNAQNVHQSLKMEWVL
jgi:hypothetical protein